MGSGQGQMAQQESDPWTTLSLIIPSIFPRRLISLRGRNHFLKFLLVFYYLYHSKMHRLSHDMLLRVLSASKLEA